MAQDRCDAINREKHLSLKFLGLLQFATFVAMLVFFLRVLKTYSAFYKQQTTCASKDSIDKFIKFEKNYQIVFWINIVSLFLLLSFLASHSHLPYRAALMLTCFLLFAAGVVCMSFSAQGFSIIQNDLRNEPPECTHLFKDLKQLFLIGLVVGVGQILVAAYNGRDAYSSGSSSSSGYYRR